MPVYKTFLIPILLLNCRSIKNKKIGLEFLIDTFSRLPICAFSETWTKDVDSNLIYPCSKNYSVYRTDRASVRQGGGVTLMVPGDIASIFCPSISISCDEFDAVWCKISSGTKLINVGVIYRPPAVTPNMPYKLIDYLDSVIEPNQPTIILGDFNYSNIDWQTLSSPAGLSDFVNFFTNLGFEQLVTFNTRRNSILDLIFSNEPNLLQCITIGPKLECCDHETIVGILPFQSKTCTTVLKRNYTSADYYSMNLVLCNVNWNAVLTAKNINSLWDQFLHVLKAVTDANIPLRTVSYTSKNVKSPKVKRLCTKAYKLHKKFKITGDSRTYDRYLIAARQAQNEKRREKYYREKQVLASGSLASYWSFIREKLVYKTRLPCLFDSSGNVVTDNLAKANLLNDFFGSVFTLDDGIQTEWKITQVCKYFTYVDFSPEVVYAKLEALPNKLSSGPDTIPYILLKNLSVSLALPLSIIFTYSFTYSCLPSDWLLALVTALFKKGSPSQCENYRPISLTCCCCRIMESIFVDNLMKHVTPYIFSGQHGFIKGKSTTTQLLECLNDWTELLDTGCFVDILYIDIAKAFDSVSHVKLLSKIRKYGIAGSAYEWIKAFLSNRRQKVIINNVESREIPVTSGVPQGSVLGPVLFSIYINDLSLSIENAMVKLFADDCKLYVAFNSSTSSNLQTEIDNLVLWAKRSQLSIAFSKCAVVHLGKSNPKHTYLFDDKPITSVASVSDLGVTIDNELKFHQHCSKIASSASVMASLIFRAFLSTDINFRMQLFKTFVRPKLEYSSQVWNPHYKMDIDKIEGVQRRFTKRLLPNMSYPERLNTLKIRSLEYRRVEADLILVFKILTSKAKLNYSDFFSLNSTQTRGHSLQLYKKDFKKDTRKYFFSNRVIDTWNSLPNDIVTATTISSFKSRLRKFDLNLIYDF